MGTAGRPRFGTHKTGTGTGTGPLVRPAAARTSSSADTDTDTADETFGKGQDGTASVPTVVQLGVVGRALTALWLVSSVKRARLWLSAFDTICSLLVPCLVPNGGCRSRPRAWSSTDRQDGREEREVSQSWR